MVAARQEAAPVARGRTFLPALEGLRGAVALAVLVYHAWILSGTPRLDGGPLRALVSTGFVGVTCFFVLSGFVLFLPVAEGRGLGPSGAYLRRRAARLIPAYEVVLLATLLLLPLLVADPGRARDSITAGSLLAHATVMAGFARLIPGYGGALGFFANPVVWTITVEVAFSVALLALARPVVRAPVRTLTALLTLSVAARVLIPHLDLTRVHADALQSMLPALLGDFALGMGAAVLYVHTRAATAVWARAATPLAGGALLVLLIAMWVCGGPDAGAAKYVVTASVRASLAVSGAFAVLILALAGGPSPLQRVLASRPARAAGRWSYGIYLVHFPVLGFVVHTLGVRHNMLLAVVVTTPTVLAIGAASYRLVERPSRRWATGRRATAEAA